MTRRHIIRHCILLALPVVALVGVSAWFLTVTVHGIVERERQWAAAEAKKVADVLLKSQDDATFVWEYSKGIVEGDMKWKRFFPAKMTWKDWDSKGAKRKSKMWGWRDVGRVRFVWVRIGSKAVAKATSIAETDWRMIFWVFAPLMLASLAALTASTIYSLVSYAKSREDFLAATAHDLTTPLAGMRLMIGRDAAEARLLNERLIRIVKNICEFMRHGGRRRYKREVFDLRKAYDEAYALFANDYRDIYDGEDVAVEDDGRPYFVMADELATVQIVWNILGNDLKYAAGHGRVAVRFSREGKVVRLAFADEGPGLDATGRRHAFDRFWRSKTVLQSGKGGFGIGLCVAREAARAMAGDLTLAQNKPRGCIFTLELPAGKGEV